MTTRQVMLTLLLICALFVGGVLPVAAQSRTLPPTTARALMRFQGEIKSRPAESPLGNWTIGDKTVMVVETTMIDETRGVAAVGARVWVIARTLATTDSAQPGLEALLIRVIDPQWPPREFVVRGIVLEKHPTFFVVNGLHILYDDHTPGAGEVKEGALVIVWATRTSEGIKAQRIRALLNPLPIVEFEGVIKRMSRELWIVGGRRVRLTESTVIDGSPLVGATVRVRGYGQRNGVVLALVITVLERPQTVEWTGRIDRIPPTITIYPPVYTGRWVVGGREVWATPETVVTGTPRIGAQAHVVAIPDGARVLRALRIEVLALTQ